MNRRSLVFAFVVCGGLVLVGLWQLTTAREPTRAVKPLEADAFGDAPSLDADPLEGESRPQLDDYVPPERKLAPPPKAPQVDNDPAKGRLWLRLLDARDNQPLTNTECELYRIEKHGGWHPSKLDSRRFTDADGLMPFTWCTEDIEDREKLLEWDAAFWTDDVYHYIFPVPVGWQPASNHHHVVDALRAILVEPGKEPIDVFAAPAANLRIVARDEWGQPLADARIKYYHLGSDNPADSWMYLHGNVQPFWDDSDWDFWMQGKAREHQRAACEAWFGGVRAEGGTNAEDFEPVLDEKPILGSTVVRGLPCVRVGAYAFRRGLGFGHATIDLQPGSNELNVYLRADPSSTLNVRVEWHGEPLEPESGFTLELATTGPFGESQFVEDSPTDCEMEWEVPTGSATVWEGRITALPPGLWRVRANFWQGGRGGSACVQVLAGQSQNVTLYCGDGALAHWTPIIRLGAKQVERCSIRLLGGEFTEPHTDTIYSDAGETTALELDTGTYTVWVPTLQPVTFTLTPGEKRSDSFTLRCSSVQFSIDAPLAELLSKETSTVQLNLYPSDEWDSAEEHLIEIDAAMRAQADDFDQLRPTVVRVWTVPLGRYTWELDGADQSIDGQLELTQLSESFHFGLRSMPGYELCEIEFQGFDGEAPAVYFYEDGSVERAINAFQHAAYDPEFTTSVEAALQTDIETLRSHDRNRLYAYGPRGSALAIVENTSAVPCRAQFPGRIVVTPSQREDPGSGTLRLTADEATSCRVVAFHETGQSDECSVPGELYFAPGWVTLVVSRQVAGRYECARIQFKFTNEEQTLNLDSLGYEAFAEVTLVFRGRGSPESSFDAWWFGGSAPAPLLLALDQSFGGSPRYVGLGEADKVLPDGRLEFSYDNRMLPPGRYKVIPWRGAAEKYCKTVTLAPGGRSTIVVEGGP